MPPLGAAHFLGLASVPCCVTHGNIFTRKVFTMTSRCVPRKRTRMVAWGQENCEKTQWSCACNPSLYLLA